MDDETKLHYEAESKQLRADLKKWENDWARTHEGSKPGRQDIKDHADIAQKYKQYSRVRDILAGKVPPPPLSKGGDESSPKKRKRDLIPSETPLKRTKHAGTPSHDRSRDDELMNTPAISRKLFSPAPVSSLGPTPQKDGRVLGLFDLFVERELATPSRKDRGVGKSPVSRQTIHATPNKRTSAVDTGSDMMLGRTPRSASRGQPLDTFMTPLKSRKEKSKGTTPVSTSKLLFDTPAFLKRNPFTAVAEIATLDAPAPLRLPRKPLVRGLSEIVASLRKVEEEKLDDDLEALRDAENEQAGLSKEQPPPQTPTDTIVEESQSQRLPLGGFDDEGMYDSPVEDAVDRNGNPMPVHRKKGQKRTTRRVNIKPTKAKRPASPHEGYVDEGVARDAQADNTGDSVRATDAADSATELEDDGEQTKETESTTKATKKDGVFKKTTRKVNELVHANFHRLKLRNSGAKGGPAYGSRFRRRR